MTLGHSVPNNNTCDVISNGISDSGTVGTSVISELFDGFYNDENQEHP